MRIKIIFMCAMLVACAVGVRAQQIGTVVAANEQRVALTEQAAALNAAGQIALGARLRTTALNGSPDSPVKNVRLVVENRSPQFYTYVSGWATFYDGEGVRCGEGQFVMNALAAGESAETDTPGLHLTCTPATWRVVANNLLTRTSDAANPSATETSAPAMTVTPELRYEINIDGQTHPLQLGNPLDVRVGKRRIRIVVNSAP